MLPKLPVLFGALSLATVSLAWKVEDLFISFTKPEDKTMDQFEQDFNNMCKITSPPGEPCVPYFNRGDFEDQNWQTIAHGACLSKVGDADYEHLTEAVLDWLGGKIIMVDDLK
ncbi:hypothetical protein IAU59_001471 [Kwoniella sp. CBS 9459]